MQAFRLVSIDHERFEPLFELSDDRLHERGAVRRVATTYPGFPCRVSLEDAQPGEELLLLPYLHQPAASPYRASGAIYIRRHARKRVLAIGEIPAYVARRELSLRAYDASHMMIAARLCAGSAVAGELAALLADQAIDYVHLHNAARGCFSCLVERA